MRKSFPAADLARDGRFRRARTEDRFEDPRTQFLPAGRRPGKLTPDRPDAAHAARQMMHGIFVGEIEACGDPVLSFCEDWMLADEVTHVKMGSDWLRRLTDGDPERRERALEFQRVVDKLFSFRGFRGEADDSPIQLARTFRRMAGFGDAEVDTIAEDARAHSDQERGSVAVGC